MKLPRFDHSKMEWDGWRAFHVDHYYNKFVQFDTGEFVVNSRRWSPDERQIYKELHLQVVATDDDKCPPLFTPGMATVVGAKPIPKSHLNHNGQQILLLDFNHKRAVSIDRTLSREDMPLIPERFTGHYSRVVAYYAGSKAVPVGSPITRHRPQQLTPDERTHIKELVDASKVWLQMQPNPDEISKKQRRDMKALPVSEFVDVSFGVLTTDHRVAIALNGFNNIIKEEHPWLTFGMSAEEDHYYNPPKEEDDDD